MKINLSLNHPKQIEKTNYIWNTKLVFMEKKNNLIIWKKYIKKKNNNNNEELL